MVRSWLQLVACISDHRIAIRTLAEELLRVEGQQHSQGEINGRKYLEIH